MQQKPDELLAKCFEELNDVLALFQMLGGIDPEGAKKNNIKHDFPSALTYLILMMRQFLKIWHNVTNNNLIKTTRNKILAECYKTFTDIINVNIPYFDSVDSINNLLNQAIDFDNGIIGRDLCSDVQKLYDIICIDTFRSKLNPRQLGLALKSADRLNVNIMDEIDQVPNDPRKFQILFQYGKSNDKYSEALYKCAIESDDVDVIVQYLTMTQDKNRFKPFYFKKLADVLNSWLNELFLHTPNQSITENPNIKKAYQQFQKCIGPLSPLDKKKLFSVVSGTDVAQALYSLVRKGVIDLNRDDHMCMDIKEIISPFKQN